MAKRRRRRRGDGSLFPRDDGRWVAQVGYRGEDGRRKFLTRICRNEDAAKLALQGLLARVGAGHELTDTREPLDDFLDGWLDRAAGTIRPSTLRSYRGHVDDHISPLLGAIPLEELRAADVDRLVRKMQQPTSRLPAGRSPATIHRVLTTLSMALESAVREGVLPRNVARLARRPKVERPEIAATTPADARRILDLVAGHELEALYTLLLGAGLRLGEAVALDWRDVDLEAATARVRTGKTARSRRVVALPPFVVEALRSHRARSTIVGKDEPVFRGARGERLRGDVAYAQWARLRRGAGLPPMRLHDLRHAHATLLLASGTPMRLIADQLGHANPNLTARVYAHVLDSQLRARIDGLEELVKSG